MVSHRQTDSLLTKPRQRCATVTASVKGAARCGAADITEIWSIGSIHRAANWAIDANGLIDVDNGVLLQNAEHVDLHSFTSDYMDQIRERLLDAEEAGGADAVRAQLQAIGQKLSQGVEAFLEGGL